MLATAINGEARRGRRAEKMPSGTPSATAMKVDPATSNTCWPNRLASSARCDSQKENRRVIREAESPQRTPWTQRLASWHNHDRVKQAPDARVGRCRDDGGA